MNLMHFNFLRSHPHSRAACEYKNAGPKISHRLFRECGRKSVDSKRLFRAGRHAHGPVSAVCGRRLLSAGAKRHDPGVPPPDRTGERVFDLCAAPGGKATELNARLKGTGLPSPMTSATPAPKHCCAIWSCSEVKTCLSPMRHRQAFADVFPGFFDKNPRGCTVLRRGHVPER